MIPHALEHEPPARPAPVASPDDLLTRAEVQRALHISRETLLRWVRARKFPAHDVVAGNWKRWRRSTLTTWLAQHTQVQP